MKKSFILLISVFYVFNLYSQWQQTNLDSVKIKSITINGNNIFAASYGDGIYLSSNNGDTWSVINTGLTNSYVYTIATSGNNVWIGTNNGVFMSSNNGVNWIPKNTTLKGSIYTIAFYGNRIYAGGGGGMYYSVDGGSTWSNVNTNNVIPSYNAIKTLVIKGDTFYAGTSNDGVFISNNIGLTWKTTYLYDSCSVYAISLNGNKIFAGIYGYYRGNGVFLSINNGTYFSGMYNGWPTFFTGATYYDIPTALIAHGDTLFAAAYGNGMNYGVYFSSDNGSSWNAMNTGLKGVKIDALTLKGDTLYAGTDGSGIWRYILSQTVEINEINRNNSIFIYPNPVIDNIKIQTKERTNLEILNIQGQVIKTVNSYEKETIIDLTSFPSGIYIIKAQTYNGIMREKFIKE